MSSPKKNATPAEMAALYEFNKKFYGSKPEREVDFRPIDFRPMPQSGGGVGSALDAAKLKEQSLRYGVPVKEFEPKRPPPLPPTQKRPPPLPPTPKRPDPLPPKEPVGTQRPALRPTGKPSNRMEYNKGGSVPSASKRADGIAQRGKTRGKMC